MWALVDGLSSRCWGFLFHLPLSIINAPPKGGLTGGESACG